ncbi:MAG TPA: tetratricopeptide repeat protein [Acidobacteriota bacterium]|nr:tetratricopeptide repeat protein [Acidobacteriota bacterium]
MKRPIGWALASAVVAFSLACARPLALRALRAGVEAAQAEDWEAAVRHWTEAVRARPDSVPAHNNLAVAHEKQGDWEAARREYEEALRLDPDNLTVKTNYAAFKIRLESARGKRP